MQQSIPIAKRQLANALCDDVAAGGRVTPGILSYMAKVMISLPDELLALVDARAHERGSTRSATIRELAQAAFGRHSDQLAQRMSELDGHATSHGGDVVGQLKAGRPA